MPDIDDIVNDIRRAYVDDGVARVRFLNNMVLWMREVMR